MQLRLILFILLLASLFFFNSCRKNAKIYHVTGVLVSDCSLKPMADVKVKVSSKSNLTSHGVTSETRTDSLGYFDLPYNPSGGSLTFKVNNNERLANIPLEEIVDLGMLIYTPTAEYVLSIDFGTAFTANDTLSLYNYVWYPSSILKIAGPFKDTIFPLDTCYPTGYQCATYGKDMDYFYHSISGELWTLNPNGEKIKLHSFNQSFKLIHCNSFPDTLKILIP